MTRRTPLPTVISHRAFTVAEALELGMPLDRLRSNDLVAPHHGIRTHADVGHTVVDRAHALLPALRRDQCFSHETAAAVWNIPIGRSLRDEPLHVTSPTDRSAMRRPGVAGHRRDGAEIDWHRGLPVTNPLRTWTDLADRGTVLDLVVAGDHLVGRNGPLAVDDLRDAARRRQNPRRAHRLREAAELIRFGAESPKESESRLRLPEPLRAVVELNIDVFEAHEFIGRPDMLFPRSMVFVEYEGDHHRTDRETFRKDIARRRRFADAGWHGVQITQLELDGAMAEFGRRLTAIVRRRDGLGDHLRHELRDGRLVAVWG